MFLVKASTESTAGAFAIIEEVDPLDSPLHVHVNEDELFYVIEGEHVFRVGEEEFPPAPVRSCSHRGGYRMHIVGWCHERGVS